MSSSKWFTESYFLLACRAGLAGRRVGQSGKEPAGTKIRRAILLVLVAAALAAMPALARSQSLLPSGDPPAISSVTAPGKLDLTYVRPTPETLELLLNSYPGLGPKCRLEGAYRFDITEMKGENYFILHRYTTIC